MDCRLSDLKHKEVISAVDGVRIGVVDDIIVDTKTACVVAFVIFNRYFLYGIFKKGEDFTVAHLFTIFPPQEGEKLEVFVYKRRNIEI